MSNNRNQLGFLDVLNIASFCIGLENLEQNLTQNDKQELESTFNNKINSLLTEVHEHLQQQDKKIDAIMKKLGVTEDDG